MKSFFRISNPLCFIRLGEPLASNPRLLRFRTSMPMILPTQRTLFQSLISILKRTMARGWGGGRVNCGRVHAMFNQELTPSEPRPNLILFDLLHCYKNSFTLSEIIIGQEKIHGRSVQFLIIKLFLCRGGYFLLPNRE